MINKQISLRYEEFLFLIFFAMITAGKGLGLGASSKLLQSITIISLMYLTVKLFTSKYTVNEVIISFLLCILGLGTYIVTKRQGVLLSIITIIGLKNISYEKVFKVAFGVRLILYILTISLAILGILENKKIIHWRDSAGFFYRYSLGYSHPNLLHSTLFILVILFIYLFYKKLNIKLYSFIFLVNLLIYKFSVSRTGFYGVIATILFTIFMKNSKGIFKYKIIKLVVPGCILFTFITAILYEKVEFINILDRLLSGRIGYTSYFLNNYSMSLFGNNLYLDDNLIDNSYIILLANYGIIIFVLYLISYNKIIKKYITLKMDKELIMIVCFSVYGITEGFLSNIFMNLSLVYIADIIFNTKSGKRLESYATNNIYTNI